MPKGDGSTQRHRGFVVSLFWSGIDLGSDRHHVIIYSGGLVHVDTLGGHSGGLTTLLFIYEGIIPHVR